MAKMERKTFDTPAETRTVEKGKIDVVKLAEVTVMRMRLEPGWVWSECVKPVVGTASCRVGHLMYVISGRMGVLMDDGSEVEFRPGDVGVIPAGHDAWIIGDEAFVGIDFQGGADYAKPKE